MSGFIVNAGDVELRAENSACVEVLTIVSWAAHLVVLISGEETVEASIVIRPPVEIVKAALPVCRSIIVKVDVFRAI